MRLLISNDDGINSEGLHILARELEKYHEVIIAAPDGQRSACGHSITLTRPLVIREVKLPQIKSKAYSIDGTPADCIRLATDKILKEKADFVISGINRGVNLGTDVIYSGTVSAAIEAAIYNVPAIAVSSGYIEGEDIHNYELAAKVTLQILEEASKKLIGSNTVLNINVPIGREEEIKGIKVCRTGRCVYEDSYVEALEESGDTSYQVIGQLVKTNERDTDAYYFEEGYITLTPLHHDLTDFSVMPSVESWNFSHNK